MRLKAVELQGFKSFPDKTHITFSDGVTAIIGPNGSGKSNISDAVRWVLGEMSLKSLRGSKMEDVIFNGAAGRNPANYTYVSITFDTGEEYAAAQAALPAGGAPAEEEQARTRPARLGDGPEVTVTRKYYRSGESEYYINKRQVRLKDIYELFYDTGIGREGYSVISQGKISEVLAQKGDERRSIFEEAAGISKIRYKKLESERKLRDTEQNLLRVNDILSEVAVRVEPLRKEAENAKRYLVLNEEKTALEITLWLDRIDKLKAERERVETSVASAKLELDTATEALDGAETGLDALINETYEMARDASETERKLAALAQTRAERESREAVLQNDMQHRRAVIASSADRKKAAETAAEAAAQKEQAAASEAVRAETEAAAAADAAGEAERAYTAASEKLRACRAERDALSERRAALFASRAELAESHARRSSELDAAQSGAADFERRLAQASRRAAELEAQLQAAADALAAAEEAADALAAAAETLRAQISESEAKAAENAERIVARRIELTAAEQRRESLLRMERLLEGYSDGVKRVLNDAGAGRLPIVCHGTVSQLISSESRYVVALETALGAAVQFLVVEKESDAKAAVEHLKRNKAGRATFLPVETVSGRLADTERVKGCAGYIGVASELAAYDPKYQGVIRELLGRTVLAETMDAALAIARAGGYRLKIVTLDGQVVSPGGSITGGSAAKRVGVFSRSADIESLSAQIKEINAAILREETEKRKSTSSAEALRAKLRENEEARASQSAEREARSADRRAAQALLDEARAACAELSDAHGGSDASLERARGLLDALDASLAEADAALARCERELENASEAQTAAELAERSALDGLTKAQLAQSTARSALDYKKELLAAAQAEAAARRNAVGETEAEARQAELEIAAAQAELEQLAAQASSAAGEETALRSTVERIAQKRDETERRIASLRADIKTLQTRKEESFRSYTGLCGRADVLNGEYETVTNKLWDEYEMTYSAACEHRLPVDKMDKAPSRLASLKAQIRAMGSINANAVEEYKETKERFDFLTAQTEDLNKTRRSLDNAISRLNASMKTTFTDCFENINRVFGEVFAELFGGGSAHLELEDPENPLECGIDIVLRPPGKTVKSISLLSGGEQSFAAIALYLALQSINPSPFCIFDEIESALDDVNLARFADYVRVHSDKTQYILITHRRGTMERADTLYGVTMRKKGISEYIRLDISELEEKMKEYA